MDLEKIEIPFGITNEGEAVSISMGLPCIGHCMIVGGTGSGKSTLLNGIIKRVVHNYNNNQVVIWTDYVPDGIEGAKKNSIIQVCVPEANIAERTISLIDRIYEEAEHRIRIMSALYVQSFYQVDSLPLIIVIIDEFFPYSYSDRSHDAAIKLETMLRMSHAVGISFIIATQEPLASISFALRELFQARIALRANLEIIKVTLDVYPAEITPETKMAMENLSSGRPGDFLFYDRNESNLIVAGHLKE